MPAEAHITPIWKKQKLFIALFFTAIGLWFSYDGEFGYPLSNQRWEKHENLKKAGHLAEWPALAKQMDWNETPPEKFYHKADIDVQFILGGLSLMIGAASFIFWTTQVKRVLKTDDEAVYAPGGKRVPFESITRIDRKKWVSKGLATVVYSINGRRGKFILDDYKFDRDPTHQIMAEIEEKRKKQE